MTDSELSPAEGPALSALLHETRRFPPPPDFAAAAIADEPLVEEAAKDPLGWWAAQAERLEWERPFSRILEWDLPYARWFADGTLNAAVNCVDRHVAAGRGAKVAYHWIGEPEGERRTITYADLQAMVCRCANALVELGVRRGDRVAIYMPMIPETVVAMLACARLGAPHSVVFGGFSAEALAGRIADADARVVVTADGGYRRGATVALKDQVDAAVARCPGVRTVLTVRRTGQPVGWDEGRDVWWHEVVDRQPPEHVAEAVEAEHPLYIMYTSGTTARPKGILHTTAGYLTHCST
ncbi:MAG TPA: AMP-binding protein, partial [Acidimicrobiales bacterium]|nr:AMP-binding protein [Acidimicrobiales bacterium]